MSPLKVFLKAFVVESELPNLDFPEEVVVAKQSLWEWFKNPIGSPPTDLISDDEVIEFRALSSKNKFIIIVSDDLKLVRKIAYSNWRKVILRIPPVEWITTGCSEENWPVNGTYEFLLDVAQIERLSEAAPMLLFGESGWFPKPLGFTEPFNVDSIEIFPEFQRNWPDDYYERPNKLLVRPY
jgi:hypothetical protein